MSAANETKREARPELIAWRNLCRRIEDLGEEILGDGPLGSHCTPTPPLERPRGAPIPSGMALPVMNAIIPR